MSTTPAAGREGTVSIEGIVPRERATGKKQHVEPAAFGS